MRNVKLAGHRVVLLLSLCVCFDTAARAVPSFARQTGLACIACHRGIPELTAFGRRFKLNGYTLTGIERYVSESDRATPGLEILKVLPLSAMIQIAGTATNSPQPGTQNGSVQFPQQLSLFLAGAFTSQVGGLIQTTYTHGSDHFTLDNSDIRFANRTRLDGKTLVYGATLNNGPTVEDLWNSTPVWGFPWVSASSAPTPAAAPVISSLGQDVAGLGAYAMWNDHLYANATLYRTEHAGGAQPPDGVGFAYNIRGAAPYWRVAWQQNVDNNYFEVGTYGIRLNSTPNAVTGLEDKFNDVAVDLQYERPFGVNLLTVHSNYIRESSTLNAAFFAGTAAQAAHHLGSFRADATYHIGSRYTATLGAFRINGTSDAALFAPAPVTGSLNGSPESTGYTAQIGYWPWQNIDLSLAYTAYTKFNGGGSNYDGSGRDASANNTAYLVAWFIF